MEAIIGRGSLTTPPIMEEADLDLGGSAMMTVTMTNAQHKALVALLGTLTVFDDEQVTVDTPSMTNQPQPTAPKAPKAKAPVDKAAKKAANKTAYRQINGFLGAATQAMNEGDAAKCGEAIAKAVAIASAKGWAHEEVRCLEAAKAHGLA